MYAQSAAMRADVLVMGGGTGGIAAGIQAARSGMKTIIVEPIQMLGGMLTAAGVSCTDGNAALHSGIWQEFREALQQHYGTNNLASGWISETCFEPHVGDSIFKAWAAKEKNLQILYSCHFESVLKKGNKVTGAAIKNENGKSVIINATVTIDATELGDVMAKARAGYDLGMEAPNYSGEKQAPGKNNIIQDITWAAILKDYGAGADKTIAKPVGYAAEKYFCSCTDAPCNSTPYKVNAQKMLDYAKLPNNKYMLNWPAHGNDTYLNVVEDNDITRNKKYEQAKNQTLGFIYFIQTQLGLKNIGFAEDELNGGMAIMPYNREGRRLKGVVRMNINHIKNPFDYSLYRTGISVGDYPVDHHHGQYPGKAPDIAFPKIPSFNIPLGALIPASIDGLIVCEKGISVSNIVNGSTRLQPCVLLTGQAAGVLAALSIQQKKAVRNVSVRAVQSVLLQLKCYLMPYADITPDNPYWEAIQRVGATGILKGTCKPEGWANKTYFYPDSTITVNEFENGMNELQLPIEINKKSKSAPLTYSDIKKVYTYLETNKFIPATTKWMNTEMKWNLEKYHFKDLTDERPLSRMEAAALIDYFIDPFQARRLTIIGEPAKN
jgi:hypothetical protein